MRIGIIGAGQLGQMLGQAATALDIQCHFLDPSPSPPAAMTGPVIRAAYDDADALQALAAESDVITYEFENVPVGALQCLPARVAVYPPAQALNVAQDRLSEKQLFGELAIPLPGYAAVNSRADLDLAAATLGLPLVLKTRRFGYDGKGQVLIRDVAEIAAAWQRLGSQALIAEQWVAFDYEVSMIAVRNVRGEIAYYPLTANDHERGILKRSRAPIDDPELTLKARQYSQRLLEQMRYVGVLALELFVVNKDLLANEFAPRVHNSGHWTIEGSVTSQFSNHLLALRGDTPGSTRCKGHAGMVNLIGAIPAAARHCDAKNVTLHDYGKAPRPGRKLGHVTLVAASADERDRQLDEITAIVAGAAQ